MTVNNKLKTEHTDLHIDEDTGFKISSDFERFNQINDMGISFDWNGS